MLRVTRRSPLVCLVLLASCSQPQPVTHSPSSAPVPNTPVTSAHSAPPAAKDLPSPQPRLEPDPAATYAMPIDGNAVDGPADAKITLVIGYDYWDPYTWKVRPILERLRRKYSNDLRIVFKQNVVHPATATAAALAFCAANVQGKAAKMDALLWEEGYKLRKYDGDTELGGSTVEHCWNTSDGCKMVTGFAKRLGLKLDQFKDDMKFRCQDTIEKDARELKRFGAIGSPSFFINGRFLAGAQPFESFERLIEEELAKANDRIRQGTPVSEYYQHWVLAKGQQSLDG